MYLLRMNDAGSWSQSIVSVDEIPTFVAPEFRLNMNTRIYLFDLPTTKAAPTPLAVTRMYDPTDDNNIVFLVQSISGLTLFEFNFPLVEV